MATQSRDVTKRDVFLFVAALSQTLTLEELQEDTKLGFGSGNAGLDSFTIVSMVDSFNIYIAVRRGGEKNDIPTGSVGESSTLGQFIDLIQARLES